LGQITGQQLSHSSAGFRLRFFRSVSDCVSANVTRLQTGTIRQALIHRRHDSRESRPLGLGHAALAAVSSDGRSYAYTFARDMSDMYLIDGLR